MQIRQTQMKGKQQKEEDITFDLSPTLPIFAVQMLQARAGEKVLVKWSWNCREGRKDGRRI